MALDDIEDQLRKKVGTWYNNSFAPILQFYTNQFPMTIFVVFYIIIKTQDQVTFKLNNSFFQIEHKFKKDHIRFTKLPSLFNYICLCFRWEVSYKVS